MKLNPYFSDLNEDILGEVIAGMRLYSFERKEAVFWEGDNCVDCIHPKWQ